MADEGIRASRGRKKERWKGDNEKMATFRRQAQKRKAVLTSEGEFSEARCCEAGDDVSDLQVYSFVGK